MQQRGKQQQSQQAQHLFTASEVAQFEYCPLVWWYDQFEAAAHADTEDLFAHLVKLEHEHGSQATAIPEYQMIEQLLVRRGAFEQGRQQHEAHAEEVAEIEEMEEERIPVPSSSTNVRRLALAVLVIVVIALILMAVGLVLR